jgi:hypothetical protein
MDAFTRRQGPRDTKRSDGDDICRGARGEVLHPHTPKSDASLELLPVGGVMCLGLLTGALDGC